MRKPTSLRLLSLFLALLLSFGALSTVALADVIRSNDGGVVAHDGSFNLEELRELLNTRSYADYLKRYENAAEGSATISVDLNTVKGDNITVSDISKYPDVFVTPQFKIESEKDINSILEKLDYDSYEIVYDYPEEHKNSRKHFYIKYTKNRPGNDMVVELGDSGTASFTVNVPKAGMYAIDIGYYPVLGKSANIERMFLVNGKVAYSESRSISMTKNWTNIYYAEYKDGNIVYNADGSIACSYRKDIQGNDIRAEAVQTPVWREYTVCDSSGYYNSLMFYLNEGENTISFVSEREGVAFKSISLVPPKSEMSYADYYESIKNLASDMGVKNGTVMWPVRIAISGKTTTPGGAIEILDILGKDESIARIDMGLLKLSQ